MTQLSDKAACLLTLSDSESPALPVLPNADAGGAATLYLLPGYDEGGASAVYLLSGYDEGGVSAIYT